MRNINLGIKRFIASVISVLLLSLSVFSSYIGASQVYASDITIAVQAYGALWEIFLGIGSTVLLSTGVIENVEDITDIDVAQFGADFMENKMGLSAETANAVCSFFIPDAPNSISDKYADAFLAYQNGSMTLEDFKSYDPYADDAFHVYISGLWDDLCNGISTFVDDVINGNNELAYSGQIISANDIYYDGNLEIIGDHINFRIYGEYSGNKGYPYITKSYSDSVVAERIAYLRQPQLEGKCYRSYVLYKISGDTISIILKALGSQNQNGSVVSTSMQVSNTYFDNGSLACNFPVFDDYSILENYLKIGDDSECINKTAIPFEFNDIWTGVSSNLSNIVSKGAYKARDLYDTLANTFSNIASGAIADSASYIENISAAVDALPSFDITDVPTDPPVGPENPDPVPPIEKPADDAGVVEWLKYIANTLSMSWTAGSDIPDIVTGIGDYAKDIPDILTGLNDGFSDVIEIGGNTWEVVARIPDIIDKQAEVTLENVTNGFNDVIEIGGGIAEKVAEIPDIIDFAKDGVLAGLIDLGDTLSLPLSGVLEGVNSHTDILEGIKSGVLSIPDSIATGIDEVLTAIRDLGLSLIDYTGLLQQILQAIKDILAFLKEFFVLDPAVVKAHALDVIQNIPAFDGFLPVVGYIDQLKGAFSDSYDYPKITMQAPDILVPYVGGQILLIDFQDYAKYFLWVRTFLAFSISFGFVLWVVKQFKVVYTVN